MLFPLFHSDLTLKNTQCLICLFTFVPGWYPNYASIINASEKGQLWFSLGVCVVTPRARLKVPLNEGSPVCQSTCPLKYSL